MSLSDVEQLRIAMALRLKGIASAEAIAESADVALDATEAELQAMVAAERAGDTPRGFRLLPAGKEWTDELLGAERAGLDQAALNQQYDEFCVHNDAFKQLVTDWQVKMVDGEQTLNDHSDEAYDAAIFARLDELHGAVGSVFAQVVELCPRLAPYLTKFDAALARVHDGDHSWFAAPMKDSYHTVWFELHEELILATGRNRADEAAAGRG